MKLILALFDRYRISINRKKSALPSACEKIVALSSTAIFPSMGRLTHIIILRGTVEDPS